MLGFHCGAGQYKDTGIGIVNYTLPYWSIAIPLTLLAAYLILWKPRASSDD
jgi:hypothetical protein